MSAPSRLPREGDWIVVSDLGFYEGPDGWLYMPVDSVHATEEEAVAVSRCEDDPLGCAPDGEVVVLDVSGYAGAPVGPLSAEDVAGVREFGGVTFVRTGRRPDRYPSVFTKKNPATDPGATTGDGVGPG